MPAKEELRDLVETLSEDQVAVLLADARRLQTASIRQERSGDISPGPQPAEPIPSARPVGLTLADLQAKRREILQIAAFRGASNVRVFGSVARGEARPDSDVDFLVDLGPGRTVLDLSELILDLEENLRCKVDVVEIRRPTIAAERILRDAVPL